MTPKGGTLFLLIIAWAASAAKPPNVINKGDCKYIIKKLMKKCQREGHPLPNAKQLKTLFNDSDLTMEDRNTDQSRNPLSIFLEALNLVRNKNSLSQLPSDVAEKMPNKEWTCGKLLTMARLIKKSPESTACYMKSFVGPMYLSTFTTQCDKSIDPENYGILLQTVKSMQMEIPNARMSLPPKVERQNLAKWMTMLKGLYDVMNKGQRTRVVQWEKDQIGQNDFNCTLRPRPDSETTSLGRCNSSLNLLDLDILGPYVSDVAQDDVDSIPKEKLCQFFHANGFKVLKRKETKKRPPSLMKKFIQRIQQCNSTEDFPKLVDKLGPLACFYDPPDLTPELSKKLLHEVEDCDNGRITKVKKRLADSIVILSMNVEALRDLGGNVNLLSPKQLSAIPASDLKEFFKKDENKNKIAWTKNQLAILVKKLLGAKNCTDVTGPEIRGLQSLAAGLPICVFKHMIPQEFPKAREVLRNLCKRMRRSQLMAILELLLKDRPLTELLKMLPEVLTRRLPLHYLIRANIRSWDQVKENNWNLPQAAYLAKTMFASNPLFCRNVSSVNRGLTCTMISTAADKDPLGVAQAIATTPQISRKQAQCAADKFLAKHKLDVKTISGDQLDLIPAVFLSYLVCKKVKDLPDSLCPNFLDKMRESNLTFLPLPAPCRSRLTQRALRCLTNGADRSELSIESVSELGPLLCELPPSQLRSMAEDVLKDSLQAMASCQNIPRQHWADIIILVKQTFGNPSDWLAETVEKVGSLLLLDDDAISTLPNKPWMKDILLYLMSNPSRYSAALKKKYCEVVNTALNADEPTVEMIEELGMCNLYLTEAQLEKMSTDTFQKTVDILGSISGYSEGQLAVLSEKAIEAFGPVSQMDESVVMDLGCIVQGFSDSDLENLSFPLDSMEDFAQCDWKETQRASVWKGVSKHNNLKVQDLGPAELVALKPFICGFSSSEIRQINTDAFRDAVGSMDKSRCPFKALQQFKELAVNEFGSPKNWNEEQVSEIGNIVAGLNVNELVSLDPSVLPFLSETCIPLIPPEHVATLSDSQLAALGPDNAIMLTDKQRAMLSEDQLKAVNKATYGSNEQLEKSEESGAPSMSVEGISALVKPVLVLLTGFLLL